MREQGDKERSYCPNCGKENEINKDCDNCNPADYCPKHNQKLNSLLFVF